MNADADYARIVEMLSGQHLPAYVAYDSFDNFNGMRNEKKHDHVVVRVNDGKIVSGSTHFNVTTNSGGAKSTAQDSNPVSRPLFDPKCYRATGERTAYYDGNDALEITLAATCKEAPGNDNYPFTTMFVDPHTLHPLDVNGSVPETEKNKGVSVVLDQRFGMYDGYVLPASFKLDVSGSGMMFWLQVHLTESYTNFQFLNSYSG